MLHARNMSKQRICQKDDFKIGKQSYSPENVASFHVRPPVIFLCAKHVHLALLNKLPLRIHVNRSSFLSMQLCFLVFASSQWMAILLLQIYMENVL